jgi:hypothetical protein
MEMALIIIKTTEDLKQVRNIYLDALASGEETLLEVEFAPGVYGPASLGLSVPAGQRVPDEIRIDITLRGKAGADPVVLTETAVQMTGRSVRLENLVLTGARTTSLKVLAGRNVVLQDCTVLANRWASDYGAISLIEIMGMGKTPIDVTVEGAWFLGNRQIGDKKGSTVLAIRRAIHTALANVLIRGTSFLGNDVATEVSITGASAVRLDDVLVHRTRTDGVFLSCEACRSTEIVHAELVVEGLDKLAALRFSPAIQMHDSRLYPLRVTGLPDTLAGLPSQIADRSGLAAWEVAVKEALSGDAPPGEALREKLEAALGR